MGRNSLSLEIDDNGGAGRDGNHNANNVAGNGDISFHTVRDRLRLKRNSSDKRDRSYSGLDRPSLRNRPHHIGRSLNRKGFISLLMPRGTCLLYFLGAFTVSAFVMSSLLLQNSISWQGNMKGGLVRSRIGLGSTLKYIPRGIARSLIEGEGLDSLRSAVRIGVRPPRLALVSFTFFYVQSMHERNFYPGVRIARSIGRLVFVKQLNGSLSASVHCDTEHVGASLLLHLGVAK